MKRPVRLLFAFTAIVGSSALASAHFVLVAPASWIVENRGPWSVSSPIQSPVQAPLLADGLFVHTAKPADPFETDIQLPNLTCAKCTLQIVQFMAGHGLNKDGGYFYYHCADLKISADPANPLDTRWAVRR